MILTYQMEIYFSVNWGNVALEKIYSKKIGNVTIENVGDENKLSDNELSVV